MKQEARVSDRNPSAQDCSWEVRAGLRQRGNAKPTNFSKAPALHSVSQNTWEMVLCISVFKQQSCNQGHRLVSLPEKADSACYHLHDFSVCL